MITRRRARAVVRTVNLIGSLVSFQWLGVLFERGQTYSWEWFGWLALAWIAFWSYEAMAEQPSPEEGDGR